MAGTLSLCMIVRDESADLEACISSMSGLADEVVVLDTGSTDGTRAIARRLADTVGDYSWEDHFGAARNAALSLCTGDFVLTLDADERFKTGGAAVRAAMLDPKLIAAEIEIQNQLDDGKVASFWATRLFRRIPGVEWTGRIHEQVEPSIGRLMRRDPSWRGARIDAVIEHHGYTAAATKEKGKGERNRRLLSMALEELKEDAPLPLRVYTTYKYGCELGGLGGGSAYLIEAGLLLLHASDVERVEVAIAGEVLVVAAKELLDEGRLSEAADAIALARTISAGHPMVLLRSAEVALARGLPEEAHSFLGLSETEGGFHFDRRAHAVVRGLTQARALEELGRPEEALSVLERLMTGGSSSGPITAALILMNERCRDPKAALRVGLAALKNNGPQPAVMRALADVAERAGMLDRAEHWRRMAEP